MGKITRKDRELIVFLGKFKLLTVSQLSALTQRSRQVLRRRIRILVSQGSALEEQKKIYDNIQGKFFFSSPTGAMVDTSHLRQRIWKPALEKAGLDYREMKQTRHSFATNALSCGENPLWIARVMGHRDTDMIIRVYGKYIENFNGTRDGNNLNDFYKGNTIKDE